MIPAINPQGNHVGGLVGFLKSIGYAIKLIRPTRIILVFDGQGNITNRRNTYADYKANRQIKRITNFQVFSSLEEESESVSTQMMRLLDYLKCLPVNISIIDKIEADDTIAYLSQKLKDDVIIYSADQDFLQLVNDRITVYSPIKKQFYRPNDVFEQYGLYPQNFITMKCLMGDKSDNLPGVKGLGPKKMFKLFPELSTTKKFTLKEAYQKATDNDADLTQSMPGHPMATSPGTPIAPDLPIIMSKHGSNPCHPDKEFRYKMARGHNCTPRIRYV